jgi:hypothetical protein
MSRDTSFYYSFLVLPPRKRNAIIAVWDFCRAVDDAVDEVVPEAEWKGGLTDAARNGPSLPSIGCAGRGGLPYDARTATACTDAHAEVSKVWTSACNRS